MSDEKRVLVLDPYEYGAMVSIINEKRTSLINQKKDTDFVNEILLKVIKAPKKKKMFYRKETVER